MMTISKTPKRKNDVPHENSPWPYRRQLMAFMLGMLAVALTVMGLLLGSLFFMPNMPIP